MSRTTKRSLLLVWYYVLFWVSMLFAIPVIIMLALCAIWEAGPYRWGEALARRIDLLRGEDADAMKALAGDDLHEGGDPR